MPTQVVRYTRRNITSVPRGSEDNMSRVGPNFNQEGLSPEGSIVSNINCIGKVFTDRLLITFYTNVTIMKLWTYPRGEQAAVTELKNKPQRVSKGKMTFCRRTKILRKKFDHRKILVDRKLLCLHLSQIWKDFRKFAQLLTQPQLIGAFRSGTRNTD